MAPRPVLEDIKQMPQAGVALSHLTGLAFMKAPLPRTIRGKDLLTWPELHVRDEKPGPMGKQWLRRPLAFPSPSYADVFSLGP